MKERTCSSFANEVVTAGAVFVAVAPVSGLPACPSTGFVLSTFWKVRIVPTVPKLPVHENVYVAGSDPAFATTCQKTPSVMLVLWLIRSTVVQPAGPARV